MSELCQLIEGEKETTNRLVRGQMDRLVNSLFLRLTNKALVNTEVSAFASVQPSPSNHQTVPPNASISQSSTVTNNSNENLSTLQITCPPTPPTHPIITSPMIKQECLEDSSITIPINVDCSDAPNDDDKRDKYDELDSVPIGTHLPSPFGTVQSMNDNEREKNRFDKVDETDEDEKGGENGGEQGGGDFELLTSGQIDEDEMDVNDVEGESVEGELTENEQMDDTEVDEECEQNGDVCDGEHEMEANGHRQDSKRCKRTAIQQKQSDTKNSNGEESITTECTTNSIQPNLVQSNRHFQCPHCPKSFYPRGNLNRHLRVYSGERPFQCDQCEKQFTQKSILNYHLLTHSGERPFTCQHCEMSFTTYDSRNRHEQAIHLHVKPYQCKQCAHSLTNRSNIIQHIRMVHFDLPKSIKQQRALNIVDGRDPKELIEKV